MNATLRTRIRSRAFPLFVVLGAVAMAACDGTTFQVIEAIEFDPSLGIDLDSMTRLESGVYIEDGVIGTGNIINAGSTVRMTYVGYISDGSSFGSSESAGFGFTMGTNGVIAGFELGIIGMAQGGTRRMIIPPELGYADEDQTGIPAGSVLIFDVEALDVSSEDPN